MWRVNVLGNDCCRKFTPPIVSFTSRLPHDPGARACAVGPPCPGASSRCAPPQVRTRRIVKSGTPSQSPRSFDSPRARLRWRLRPWLAWSHCPQPWCARSCVGHRRGSSSRRVDRPRRIRRGRTSAARL
eukprot:7320380-Prymnesium_polylepis.2